MTQAAVSRDVGRDRSQKRRDRGVEGTISPGAPVKTDFGYERSHDHTHGLQVRGFLAGIPGAERFNGQVIAVPPFAFEPDAWTRCLIKGLSKLRFNNINVAEVGVGTGIIAGYLLTNFRGIRALFGSDIDKRLSRLAAANVRAINPDDDRYVQVRGDKSLIGWLRTSAVRPPIHRIYACIPQVKIPHGQHGADNSAHYYSPSKFNSSFNDYSLGLNHRLLLQAHNSLAPGGDIILNLAGRPSKEVLLQLFRSSGFKPQIIHEECIQQHPTTKLAPLVEDERSIRSQPGRGSFTFEFFSSAKCEPGSKVSAAEAQEMLERAEPVPVYHKIYVVRGVRQEKARASA